MSLNLDEYIIEGDFKKTIEYLLKKTSAENLKSFFTNCSTELSIHIENESKKRSIEQAEGVNSSNDENKKIKSNDLNSKSISSIYLHQETASFVEPRGKFSAKITSTGLLLEGKSTCFVAWNMISNAFLIPAWQTTKKDGEDLLVFHTSDPIIKSDNKKISNFVWTLGKDMKKPLDVTSTMPTGLDSINGFGTESDVISRIFAFVWGAPLDVPKTGVFSSLVGKSKPYVQCYKGTSNGALYPLASGILFFKPVLFLHCSDIEGIVAGRGGSAQTRYIDLKVEALGKEYEFTNIDRDELPAFTGYVQYVLKNSQKQHAKALKRIQQGSNHANKDNDNRSKDGKNENKPIDLSNENIQNSCNNKNNTNNDNSSSRSNDNNHSNSNSNVTASNALATFMGGAMGIGGATNNTTNTTNAALMQNALLANNDNDNEKMSSNHSNGVLNINDDDSDDEEDEDFDPNAPDSQASSSDNDDDDDDDDDDNDDKDDDPNDPDATDDEEGGETVDRETMDLT